MSHDVTKSGGGVLAEVPKLSPELRKILDRRKVVPDYGGDEGVSFGGGNFREGVWDPPAWVDARERDEAKRAQSAYEIQLRPVTAERIREFLLFLWNSTKHQNDTSWECVAAVYPMMLDGHPAWCFRPERLKLAAQTAFDWFPTVRQLVEFMEPDRQAILQKVAGLRTVAETPTTAPKEAAAAGSLRPWAEGGAEDNERWNRERADRERRELVEIMRKRDEEAGRPVAETVVPPRGRDETDKAYVSRLVQHCRVQIDAGERARRADEGRYRRAKEIETAERRAEVRQPRTPPPSPETMAAAYAETGLDPDAWRRKEAGDANSAGS